MKNVYCVELGGAQFRISKIIVESGYEGLHNKRVASNGTYGASDQHHDIPNNTSSSKQHSGPDASSLRRKLI